MPALGDPAWQQKGGSLSHNTACKEYGLTEEEIFEALRAGKIQYRRGAMHGNPFLRLLREEVEALAEAKHGRDHLQNQKKTRELAAVRRDLKKLDKQIAVLKARESELVASLEK